MRTYCIANKSGRFALLVNQEVVCFISFYIILWVIILLFFAKYLSLHRDIQPFAEYAVTPCMGVWIETGNTLQHFNPIKSHPVWVCGLKHPIESNDCPIDMSHPVWVCGLKLLAALGKSWLWKSHPVWVCGLKLHRIKSNDADIQSHPVWVCGLKQGWRYSNTRCS